MTGTFQSDTGGTFIPLLSWEWGKPKREKMHKASESEISLLEARKKLLKGIIELF